MTVATSRSSPARRPPHVPLGDAADWLGLYRFSVEQYHQLIDQGILPEDGSYELLRGLVVEKDTGTLGEETVGHKPPHALVVALLSPLIAQINSSKRHLRIQLPVVAGRDDAPEPDGSIVRGVPRDYASHLPTAADTFCVIEIAHSSLERDESEKLAIYAAGGIPQYLIINLRSGAIEHYADPDPAAALYRSKTTVSGDQIIRLNLGDNEWLDVKAGELLP